MTTHTMIVSFDPSMQDAELDQYLKDIERLVLDTGHVRTFAARRHIRVPGDDHAPLFVASAIIRLEMADLDALDALFATPGMGEFIRSWQARFPYRVVWANHEALV